MKRLSRIVAVTALALMATASPALATRGQPDRMVPFKGSVLALDNGQIFPTAEEPLDCPEGALWQFFSRGTGQMSHLGRSHFDLIQCSRFAGAPGDVASEGTTTFTAANGDMLVLAQTMTTTIYLNEFGAPDGFDGSGTWTVLVGSGRFASATGSGTLVVIGDIPFDDTPMFDLPPGGTMWSFTGMISYDASNRSNR